MWRFLQPQSHWTLSSKVPWLEKPMEEAGAQLSAQLPTGSAAYVNKHTAKTNLLSYYELWITMRIYLRKLCFSANFMIYSQSNSIASADDLFCQRTCWDDCCCEEMKLHNKLLDGFWILEEFEFENRIIPQAWIWHRRTSCDIFVKLDLHWRNISRNKHPVFHRVGGKQHFMWVLIRSDDNDRKLILTHE